MDTIIKVGRGTDMKAKVSTFAPKNWVYVNFENGGKWCFDAATLEDVKAQCHRMPSIPDAHTQKQNIIEMIGKESK